MQSTWKSWAAVRINEVMAIDEIHRILSSVILKTDEKVTKKRSFKIGDINV